MRHSVYTVLNSAYMTFGKIFVRSYLEHNLDNCEHLFILDAGLSTDDIVWLSKHSEGKVKIITSDINTTFRNGNTSEDWTKTVVAKTYGLREILNVYNTTPIVMIDSDCLILDKISSLIDIEKDIQICHRLNHQTPMLGSYVSINRKCNEFLDAWIETIPTINTPWKESPALSLIYRKFKDTLNIGLINEHIVSCFEKDKVDDKVKIVHFKSGAAHRTIEESIQRRIYDRGFGNMVNKYLV